MGAAVVADDGAIFALNTWLPDTLLRVELPSSVCQLMGNEPLDCRETRGCAVCRGHLNETHCYPATTQAPSGYIDFITYLVKPL